MQGSVKDEEYIYCLKNLSDAQQFLRKNPQIVTLTNNPGSTRYYGILIIDYIFKKLMKEFPFIVKIIVNVEDDHAALFTAVKMGYKNIIYTGNSKEANKLISCL